MIEKFEFSDTKQVRKSLLISSFIGVFFDSLIKYSTGNFEFLGFKIPIKDASIILHLIGYLVLYFIVALLIRYSDENLKKHYSNLKEFKTLEKDDDIMDFLEEKFGTGRKGYRIEFTKFGMVFIDLIFPILFGAYTLFEVFKS
jgi:hypothetical protein